MDGFSVVRGAAEPYVLVSPDNQSQQQTDQPHLTVCRESVRSVLLRQSP